MPEIILKTVETLPSIDRSNIDQWRGVEQKLGQQIFENDREANRLIQEAQKLQESISKNRGTRARLRNEREAIRLAIRRLEDFEE